MYNKMSLGAALSPFCVNADIAKALSTLCRDSQPSPSSCIVDVPRTLANRTAFGDTAAALPAAVKRPERNMSRRVQYVFSFIARVLVHRRGSRPRDAPRYRTHRTAVYS